MPTASSRKKTRAKAGRAPVSRRGASARARGPQKKKSPVKDGGNRPKKTATVPVPAKSPAAAAPPATHPPQTAAAPRPGPARPAGPGGVAKKSQRRTSLSQRRGPDGELLAPGELLLPAGPQTPEEIQYLFRGCVAAEHPAGDAGVAVVQAKRQATGTDPAAERVELTRQVASLVQRFDSGTIEPLLPPRPPSTRRNFTGVVDRAKLRRREIGAFLRGLHLGHTETSHMDSHGEASLESLMQWAARLENLAEAEEQAQVDYAQFHRALDHLENTTEALIVDVELTLRRLRDRVRPSRVSNPRPS